MLWAGDSRAYVFDHRGAHQLTTDDLRDPGDAMANLVHDSIVSNAMSADTDFTVNYRRVVLKAPFLVCCATDGCFGYVPSPMHFEHLVLDSLSDARSVAAWSRAIQTKVAAVTGDDAAMAMMGVGAELEEFQSLFAPRVAELEDSYIAPFDESSRAVADAERALEAARRSHQDLIAKRWSAYQPDYERHLKPEPPGDEEQADNEPASTDELESAEEATS